MDSLKKQGAVAFAWDFFGKLANQGSSFVISIFLARLLEPEEFGLIAMVMVIVGIGAVFTDVGFGSALIQRRRVHPAHYSSVFYFNILIGILLTLVTFISASWIGEFYHNEALVPITRAVAFMFVINAFSSLQTTKLRRELNYAALTKINFLSSLLSGIIGVALAFYGAGVWSLVAQVLLRGVFYNIHIWFVSRWVPTLQFSLKALRQLWAFGFHIFLSSILDAVFRRLDVIIIGKLFTPAALGYYSRAKALDQLAVKYSSGSLMAILFPLLSKIQHDLARFQAIVVKSLDILSFVIFMFLGGLYLTAHELVVLLYSDKWLPAVDFYKILVLSGFAYPISALFVNILKSRGKSKDFLKLEIYKKILAGINLYVGFLWGIDGYLYGLVIVSAIATAMNLVFASKEIELSIHTLTKPILIQMSVAIFSVLTVMLLTFKMEYGLVIMLFLKGLLFLLVYFSINHLFKTASYHQFILQAAPVIQKKFGRFNPVKGK